MRLEIYILSYAFYQSFKMTCHVELILVTCRFLFFSELQFTTALLFIIYSLIYSPFYSREDIHRKDLLKDCFHLVCITSCIYLLLSQLNCIYETCALLVPCFRNEGGIFKQMNSPKPLCKELFKMLKHFIEPFIDAIMYFNSNA